MQINLMDKPQNILDRLVKELEATDNLCAEGDPFTMTREDYLHNLIWIITGKNLQTLEGIYKSKVTSGSVGDKHE